MIRTQIYVPDDLHRELILMVKRSGKNFSELIREGIRQVIRSDRKIRGKTWGKGLIGAYKVKTKTNSIKAIRDYYRNRAI